MEEKRPAGIIEVRAHGGGGAAATHGVLIIGIGFRRGKTRFRMHELGTWNVIDVVVIVVVVIVVALAVHDVPLLSLSFTMFCSSFTDQATKVHSATTGKQNHKGKERKKITEGGKE